MQLELTINIAMDNPLEQVLEHTLIPAGVMLEMLLRAQLLALQKENLAI